MPVFARNAVTLVADRKRHRGEAHRYAIPDVVVDTSDAVRRREVTGVIVTNGYFHWDVDVLTFTVKSRRASGGDTRPADARHWRATKIPRRPWRDCAAPRRGRRRATAETFRWLLPAPPHHRAAPRFHRRRRRRILEPRRHRLPRRADRRP